MRLAFASGLLLLLAACGDRERADAEFAAEIERLSTPPDRREKLENRQEPEPAVPDLRLEPLAPDEAQLSAAPGRRCLFAVEGRVLLAATGFEAAARVNGEPVRLRTAAPVGPSGGFFTAEGLTVSIGRLTGAADLAAQAGRWSARAAVSGGAGVRPATIEGLWSCS